MLQESERLCREFLVRVPPGLESQLVFRGEFASEVELVPAKLKLQFHWCSNLGSYKKLSGMLIKTLGVAGTIKGALKSVTRHRMFYGVTEGADVLHHGWVTLGRCNQYHIEPSAAVVGPIWTSPQARGRGIATFALSHVIKELVGLNRRVIYIDTSCDNAPCLKVIDNCGFGSPIATYIRP